MLLPAWTAIHGRRALQRTDLFDMPRRFRWHRTCCLIPSRKTRTMRPGANFTLDPDGRNLCIPWLR